jgi:hypothetical protein
VDKIWGQDLTRDVLSVVTLFLAKVIGGHGTNRHDFHAIFELNSARMRAYTHMDPLHLLKITYLHHCMFYTITNTRFTIGGASDL